MQGQYRAYAPQQQPPQRSPHASNPRRGNMNGAMMNANAHQQAQITQAQLAQQQQQQAQANELAKRRSRKPTDKSIPDGVEGDIVNPEMAQQYEELRNIERLLDTTMTRKRLDVIESVQRPTAMYKTMRIWITNTVEDQVWQGNGLNVDAFDFNPTMESSYRVKIEGALLEDSEEEQKKPAEAAPAAEGEAAEAPAPAAAPTKPSFSHFFKAITVDFDRSRSRNGAEQAVEWKKPEAAGRPGQPAPEAPGAEFDEFTFKRSGDENSNITINLFRHELPERYLLSPELAAAVDMTEATQQEAVMGLWEYIRAAGLQEDEEKRNFRCDDILRQIVGRGDVGYIPLLNEYVAQHIRALPPISLPYTVRVDEEFHKDPKPTIYDIRVAVEDPLRAKLLALLNKPEYSNMLKEITGMDDQLARVIQAVTVSKAKHGFLTALAEDPANFVKNWLSSQKRDLEVILGETANSGETTSGDEWRRGGNESVWGTQNARESVSVLLSRQR